MHYQKNKPQEDGNFIVYDFGSNSTTKREMIERADIRLLVCGTKPYELGDTVCLQASFAGVHAHLICPFVAEGLRDELAEALQNDYHKVIFSEYQPELTCSDCNTRHYKTIIGRYIEECED